MASWSKSSIEKRALSYCSAAGEVVAETLWPTRCAVCDAPGELICDRCRKKLPYIDAWQACPRCGAAFGRLQCTECNPIVLASAKRSRPPFASMASALEFTAASKRVVLSYKDKGDRRLAQEMAAIMAAYLKPNLMPAPQALTYIPSSATARRRRGFDHAELLAEALARTCNMAPLGLLQQPRASDQRALSRSERLANMEGIFSVLPGASVPESVLLIDDVCTTGATLYAACDALGKAGAAAVHCLTFARVLR